jgi:hypothetical protein
VRQAPGAQLPVQVQMNYNAAHFRKEASVRLTLRASYYEKILRSAFPPPPDAFSPKPSLAPSRIPAFALTSPWAGRQATLHEFARRLLRAHAFCVPGGRSAPLCTRSKMAAAPALAVSKIAGEKPKPEGRTMKKWNLFYLSGLLSFLTAMLNFITAKNRFTAVVWLCLGSTFLCLGASQQKK